MSIYVYRNNQQAGPFEEAIILGWLNNGMLSPEDFAYRTEAREWQPLRKLFSAPAATGGQGFYNQPVVEWARRTLAKPVEIKLKFDSLVAKIITYSLLLFVPVVALIAALYNLVASSFSPKAWSAAAFAGVIALVFAAIVFVIRLTRTKIAKFLTAEGAETIYGKRFRWEDLHFVNYQKVKPKGLVQAIIFAGSQRVTVELVFASGKTVIAPLARNQAEILSLLETIPVQRRDGGKIRQ